MNRTLKKGLALFMTLVMCICLLPTMLLTATATEAANKADFDTFEKGDSSYKNPYTTANGWTTVNCAIQTGGSKDSNPQFTVIGEDDTHKAPCLNGKTSAPGKVTSPTLTGGISKLTMSYTKMFTDVKLSVTITVTDLATGTAYTQTVARDVESDTDKYVVWDYEWVLENPITGDFTIEVVNDCPSGQNGNKDRFTILELAWEANGGETPAPECQHTNTTVEGAVEATCTTDGHTGKTVCSDCGETISEGEVITATGHKYENGTCTGCGQAEPAAPSFGVIDAPVAGTAYKFGMIQENVSATDVYYLAGGMSTYYLATTTDVNAAIDVYLEETTGGYYFYTFVDGTKTYINMVVSGTHVNGAYEATASTVYRFDEESKTLIADIDGKDYWFGTRNDKKYTTVGPCATSYNGFYCQFYGEAETPAPECQHTNTTVEGAVEATCTTDGHTGKTVCADCGATVSEGEVIAATGHKYENGVCTGCGQAEPAAPSFGVIDAPVAGTAYKFGMIQENVSATDVYYLAGGMDGYYMATTTDKDAAIDVYLEETEGGYYFYTFVNGTKTYINMVVSGTHVNGAYEATASTIYRYDAESKTLIAEIDGKDYWFGTRNDKQYTTVGPCATSYNGFYCQFYGEINNGAQMPETGDHSLLAVVTVLLLSSAALVVTSKKRDLV